MLSMESIVEFKIGARQRKKLGDVFASGNYGSEEDFLNLMQKWERTGRLVEVKPQQSKEAELADLIAKELQAVDFAKEIEQDNYNRVYSKNADYGIYPKISLAVDTLGDAQQVINQLIRNFRIDENNISATTAKEEYSGKSYVKITIYNVPVKTAMQIDKMYGFKKVANTISGTVQKTADTALSTANMAMDNIAVPVAKTAIGTSAKVAKSIFGFGAKLAGITVAEVAKASKECVRDIKEDINIAEARGEVIEGVHQIRHAVNNKKRNSFFGGIIIED